jgi:tetratricopeptide (TPR) repeat protein
MQLEAAAPSSTVEIGQLVRHWAAVVPTDPHAATSAARWAVRAGDAAVAAAAIDEAIEFYGRAATLWVGSTAEHVDTLIRLGVAMSSSGRRDEGDQCLRTALVLADGIGDAALYARAAIGLAATVRYGHSDPERIEILDGAVARLGADEWVHRPAALVTLKRQLGYDSSAAAYRKRQTAAELVRQAVNRPETSAESLIAIGSLRDSIPVDDPIELRRLSERIIAAATPSRDLPVLANAWYGMAWSALELSDIGRWHEAVASYTDIAEQLRLPYELALAATMAATSAQMTGRYAEADVAASAARAHAVDDANAQAVQLANSVLCGIDRGQAGVMLELMLAVQGDYEHVPTFMAGLAVTAASAGDAARAADLLDRQAAKGFDDVRRDAEWLPVIGFLSHACAIAGVTRHADALHQLLGESPARGVRIGPVAAWWGPVRHHLGALDRLLGRLDSAEQHLEAALRLEAEMGARPFEARTQIELAAVLAMSTGADERVHALRTAAAATARELGAPGLLAVVG